MTSKDILRALREPLQDFTNELVVQIGVLAGEAGSIRADEDTIFFACASGEYGIINIAFAEPPLLPAVTILINSELYGRVRDEFKHVFRYSETGRVGSGTTTIIKLRAHDVDRYSAASPYHPPQKVPRRGRRLSSNIIRSPRCRGS